MRLPSPLETTLTRPPAPDTWHEPPEPARRTNVPPGATAGPGRLLCRAAAWAPVVVGAVLLAAAALKGLQLATEPVPARGLLSSRFVLAAVVEGEFLLGLVLLLGVFPGAARRLALAAWLAF